MSASQMKFRQKQDGRIRGAEERRGGTATAEVVEKENREDKSLNKEKI